MKKQTNFFLLLITISLLFLPWGCSQPPAKQPGKINLSPAQWPAGELEKYTKLSLAAGADKPAAESRKGMVAGTFGPLAIRSGVEALKQGGSAADAALTTALAQVALLGGSNVSYAGVMFLVYYDAETGNTYSLDAGWNTCKNETDPMSIPAVGTASGRQTLVPGFMAGVQAAHQRFGKLPFASLFDPAIYIAETGFVLDKLMEGRFKSREDVIQRFPATKAMLTKKNGQLYRAGDRFKQPAVAQTLRNIARQGAAYMYTGEWAEKFVAAVQKAGGKMSLQDLADYKAAWSQPARTGYGAYDVFSVGAPGFDGAAMIGGFNLMELADLKKTGHYAQSPETLYQFIRIARVAALYPFLGAGDNGVRGIFKKHFGLEDFSREAIMSKKTARHIWGKMQTRVWKAFEQDMAGLYSQNEAENEAYIKEVEKNMKKRTEGSKKITHSDCVVAVDEKGNMAALVHSINSFYYGYGLTVDGVSISDTAASMQDFIKRAGPGKRLPASTNQVLVLKNKKPFLATACIGTALLEATMQCVSNVVDFGMDPQAAVETGTFMTASMYPGEYLKQMVGNGQFSKELLEAVRALGQDIKVLEKAKPWQYVAPWAGIRRDPETGRMKGGVVRVLNGLSIGL